MSCEEIKDMVEKLGFFVCHEDETTEAYFITVEKPKSVRGRRNPKDHKMFTIRITKQEKLMSELSTEVQDWIADASMNELDHSLRELGHSRREFSGWMFTFLLELHKPLEDAIVAEILKRQKEEAAKKDLSLPQLEITERLIAMCKGQFDDVVLLEGDIIRNADGQKIYFVNPFDRQKLKMHSNGTIFLPTPERLRLLAGMSTQEWLAQLRIFTQDGYTFPETCVRVYMKNATGNRVIVEARGKVWSDSKKIWE